MKPVYYSDNDPYCCQVLRKQIGLGNLPAGMVDSRDIRSIKRHDLTGYCQVHLFAGIGGFPLGLKRAGVPDDFSICTGGFPCQDISRVGRREGIHGRESSLWFTFAKVIGLLRPKYVIVENTTALLIRGMSEVLGSLASLGYNAEWDCLPAASFGAPHIRDRVFIVAVQENSVRTALLHDALRLRYQTPEKTLFSGRKSIELSSWWSCEPNLGRVAHGVSSGVDRRRVLGNAVVPQIIEYIGRQLLKHEKMDISRGHSLLR